ncbi:uncharacterized protein LOC134266201, partial [Saccostrea cucullata]|uniref:uncharacterized protein LOC134266201 n=1 Tax=Saccostrea cuccullata TaxID=36930 RepID=UPI002ED5E5B9
TTGSSTTKTTKKRPKIPLKTRPTTTSTSVTSSTINATSTTESLISTRNLSSTPTSEILTPTPDLDVVKKKEHALMTAVIFLSCLSFLMLVLVCLFLHKKKLRRMKRTRKLPLAEGLGSSDVIFINSRDRRTERYFEKKFE